MSETISRWTQDFTRRDFTVEEILRLQELGIIGEDDNFELVEGEIVPMQAKTHRHELIKISITIALAKALPDHLWMGVESSMYLSDRTILEPDLVVYPRGIELEAVQGGDMILAIEVALTTLGYDLGRKAKLYARYGVQELWVIDAKRRLTHVHRGAVEDGWGSIDILPGSARLEHPALPGMSVCLDEI